MQRPHASSLPLLLTFLLAPAAFTFFPAQADAQLVLESGGVQFRGPSLIEVRSTNGALDVDEVTGRSTAVARGFGRYGSVSASARAESTQHVCVTPCRFQLNRPMELRVDARNIRLIPDGSVQRFLVEPQNRAGRTLGIMGMSFGLAALGSGGILLGLHRLSAEGNDDYGRIGPILLGSGGILFLVGLVATIASKGRVQRVDRFDF